MLTNWGWMIIFWGILRISYWKWGSSKISYIVYILRYLYMYISLESLKNIPQEWSKHRGLRDWIQSARRNWNSSHTIGTTTKKSRLWSLRRCSWPTSELMMNNSYLTLKYCPTFSNGQFNWWCWFNRRDEIMVNLLIAQVLFVTGGFSDGVPLSSTEVSWWKYVFQRIINNWPNI